MMSVENTYLQRMADLQFPGESTPEPMPEPMQIAQAPAQTMTDVPADSGDFAPSGAAPDDDIPF